MSGLTPSEQLGVRDFLTFYQNATDDCDGDATLLHFDLAKVVCKNLVRPQTFAEACDLIVLHSSSLGSLLSRKAITKPTLFKYLHARRVAVHAELSKAVLVERLADYWTSAFSDPTTTTSVDISAVAASLPSSDTASAAYATTICGTLEQPPTTTTIDPSSSRQIDVPENFPIHRMSRQFAGWFFSQFNSGELTAVDFWSDAQLHVDMIDSSAGGGQQQQLDAQGSAACAAQLLELRDRYAVFFNPNETHSGCQGRVDAHGLVLVLSCGTLHVRHALVGCWESAFGLARDPFADNNWKVKHMRLRLRTAAMSAGGQRQLAECETFGEMLALPASEEDLV